MIINVEDEPYVSISVIDGFRMLCLLSDETLCLTELPTISNLVK